MIFSGLLCQLTRVILLGPNEMNNLNGYNWPVGFLARARGHAIKTFINKAEHRVSISASCPLSIEPF